MPYSDPEPLTWDELDLLADWTEGQLTGPDADHIAHLVATDPRWTHAHTTITTNQPTITNALTTAAPTPHEPIPPDILTRLTNALDAAALDDHLTAALDSAAETSPGWRRRHVARRTRSRIATRPHRARARLAGVAAAVLVLCAGGGVALLNQFTSMADNSAATSAEGGPLPSAYEPAPPAADGALPPTVSSGTDYTEQTLPLVAQLLTAAQVPAPTIQRPFAGADNFADCVATVLAAHPGTAVLVDIARYRGRPAVIVLVAGNDRRLTAVAISATCEGDGAGELAAVVFD